MMNQAIAVQNLCKTYIVNKRQNHVLKNVSFRVDDGELVAVMGPSGSGKTTLLYSVSGMDKPTTGTVDFYGKKLHEASADEMSDIRLDEMGFIFQQMYMLKSLSICDNILLPAYRSHLTKNAADRKKKDQRARELMQKLGIIEIADNDITETSGGQLQRACICRSMINNPKMLFADEPTGSLNKQASKEVMAEIIRINQEGTTVMLVTHDVRIAAKCDRVLYIVDGNIHSHYELGKYAGENQLRERERALNNSLIDMGW